MKVFKCKFVTNEGDPDYSSFEEIFISETPQQIFIKFEELFKDDYRTELHDRHLLISELKNIEGTDGNTYDLIPVSSQRN